MYYKMASDQFYTSESKFFKRAFITGGFAYVQLQEGETAQTGWSEITQADWDSVTAPSLNQVKNNKKSELLQSYYASFTTFQSSATGVLKNYPIDKEAQDNLKDYQDRAVLNPNKDVFAFKTVEDKTLIDHTRSQFLQLLDDAESFKVAQTRHYDDLINQVDAATDEATVNAITW